MLQEDAQAIVRQNFLAGPVCLDLLGLCATLCVAMGFLWIKKAPVMTETIWLEMDVIPYVFKKPTGRVLK